jgi:hypothetical protein
MECGAFTMNRIQPFSLLITVLISGCGGTSNDTESSSAGNTASAFGGAAGHTQGLGGLAGSNAGNSSGGSPGGSLGVGGSTGGSQAGAVGYAGGATVISDDGKRLVVLPLFFVPTDSYLSDNEAASSRSLLLEHMLVAQRRYQILLQADTFYFEVADPAIYHAKRATVDYDQGVPDSAHVMTKELLDWKGEDRNKSRHVFVVMFVRQPNVNCGGSLACMGGSRPFNGRQGTGGGFTQLEYQSLVSDSPYPFQSTIIHELGHAFGLTHADCYGEDMSNSVSIMSYDPTHHSRGLVESTTPGVFLPEEYYLLNLAKQAFPHYVYDATKHNPTNKSLVNVDGRCEIPAMGASIGPMERFGYQLFWDGALVSGADAQFMTLGEGKDNCQWNITTYGSTKVVRCLYDGVLIGTNQ